MPFDQSVVQGGRGQGNFHCSSGIQSEAHRQSLSIFYACDYKIFPLMLTIVIDIKLADRHRSSTLWRKTEDLSKHFPIKANYMNKLENYIYSLAHDNNCY
jgi:hypothetical protein